MSGGPSEAAGILPGDKIIKVGDSVIVGEKLSNQRIVSFLRGRKAAKYNFQCCAQAAKNYISIGLPASTTVKSVDAAYMISERVGYIRVNRFTAQTDKEFLESMRILSNRAT